MTIEAEASDNDLGKVIAPKEAMNLFGCDPQVLKRILENAQKDRAESIAEFQKAFGPDTELKIDNGNE